MSEPAQAMDATVEAHPASQPQSQPTSSGLLGDLKSVRPDLSVVPDQNIGTEWFVRDGVKGEGDRPEWLLKKYGYNLEKQAQALPHAEKMIGSTQGAPEEYDFGQYKESFDLADPNIQEFIQFSKINRLSQDVFSKAIDTFVKYAQARTPDHSKELEKLGPDGAQKIQTVTLWAQNNLSPKSLATLSEICDTADVVEFLDEIRQYQYHQRSQPPIGSVVPNSFTPLTKAQVESEMASNYSRYCNDKAYRDEIAKKFEQAVG